MFKQQRIQLPTTEGGAQQQQQQQTKRSSWSIPCCSHLSIRGQRIQLPDDSDSEEQQNEFIIPPSHHHVTPFNIDFNSNGSNSTSNPHILSHNPFARAEEQQRQQQPTKIVVDETAVTQKESNIEEAEELADFACTSNKYANEPDWTEMYQDDEETSSLNTQQVDTQEEEEEEAEEEKAEEEEAEEEEAGEEEVEEEEQVEEEQAEEAEKIPQIEKEVLKLLPLPELSNEIPPTLIHKKPSFEKSMYGEQPLMSTTSTTTSTTNKPRFSRFSMTEQDFLALKKKEKEEKEVQETIPTTEYPLSAAITQQRRSSIVTTAAQSILGDKLDDFTEKLAFIKKNIIMSIDSDDEEEEEADNAKETLKKMALLQQQQQSARPQRPQLEHRRTSSLMDVAPTLARFMNQMTLTNEEKKLLPTTTSSFSLFSSLGNTSGPIPETSFSAPPTIISQQQEEDDELFDFHKVIEIGKNMKTFSEGFVGNGIRILNDVATRIKTSVEEEEE